MTDSEKRSDNIIGFGCLILLVGPGLVITIVNVIKAVQNDTPVFSTLWLGISGLLFSFHIHPGILVIFGVAGVVYLINFILKKFLGEKYISKFWIHLAILIFSNIPAIYLYKIYLWLFKGIGLFKSLKPEDKSISEYLIIYLIIVALFVWQNHKDEEYNRL